MSETHRSAYEREIRAYLLGRMGKEHSTAPISATRAKLPTPPILAWWIFEGQRYRGLDQCLAREFSRVHRQAIRLRATYNPHWRYVQAPEGDVDWVATAFASATSRAPEYVCKTSKIGLSAEEREALDGWLAWLGTLWDGYLSAVSPPEGAPQSVPWELPTLVRFEDRQLRRWAHVAKRSRWPLLRNVVAETLRCVFEPQALDALPLPSDYPTLFELVCIVRVLTALEPAPRSIRWLDLKSGQNTIETALGTVYFQLSLPRSEILAGSPFDDASRDGIERFGVSVPGRIDALLMFREPNNGFDGILLEAKSGTQDASEALYQLLCYRAVLRRRGVGALVVVGVTEEEAARVAAVPAAQGDDVWVFPALEALQATAGKVLGGAQESTGQGPVLSVGLGA